MSDLAALADGRPDEGQMRLATGPPGILDVTQLVAALAGGSALGQLSAAIADRLGFVAGPMRDVMRAAALFGTDFAVSDLAIVLGRSAADLIPAVDEACAAGVLASPAMTSGSGTR